MTDLNDLTWLQELLQLQSQKAKSTQEQTENLRQIRARLTVDRRDAMMTRIKLLRGKIDGMGDASPSLQAIRSIAADLVTLAEQSISKPDTFRSLEVTIELCDRYKILVPPLGKDHPAIVALFEMHDIFRLLNDYEPKRWWQFWK